MRKFNTFKYWSKYKYLQIYSNVFYCILLLDWPIDGGTTALIKKTYKMDLTTVQDNFVNGWFETYIMF